jgi:hypothetical protein
VTQLLGPVASVPSTDIFLQLVESETQYPCGRSPTRYGEADLNKDKQMAATEPLPDANSAPDGAKGAVFVNSDPVPEGALPVRGLDFNLHSDADISVIDLVDGMSRMGFQASAIGDAVRIINEMVRRYLLSSERRTK